jgi:hypothetical protein
MPEVIIKYKKPETLKMLKSLAKYLDFHVSGDRDVVNSDNVLVPGDKTLDIEALREVFTGKNIDARELRKSAWKR